MVIRKMPTSDLTTSLPSTIGSSYEREELLALYEIARVTARTDDLREQFQQVLDILSRFFGMERGMISVLDLSTGEAWPDVARGIEIRICCRPGEGITGKVAQTGRPIAAANRPGDVRELENCIERAVLLANGDAIEAHHLPPTLQMKPEKLRGQNGGKLDALVNAFERELIIDALKDTCGNQAQAARLLGTTKRIIQYKVKKYKIDPRMFRTKNAP